MVKPSLALVPLLVFMAPFAYSATTSERDIKLNPNPHVRYAITAVVHGAPGPFDRVEGAAQYQVTDRKCVPLARGEGAAQFPEKRVPVELRRIGDDTYQGYVYVDLLRDEDYFQMGTCHWHLIGADVSFQVNKLYFSPSLFHDDIVAQRPMVRFFSKRSYALSSTQRVDTGNARREDFEEDSDSTFSIEIAARESTP